VTFSGLEKPVSETTVLPHQFLCRQFSEVTMDVLLYFQNWLNYSINRVPITLKPQFLKDSHRMTAC
jgi:hypothetical protein